MKSRLVSSIGKSAFQSLALTRLHLYELCLQLASLTAIVLVLTGCSAIGETAQRTLENRSDRAAQASGIHTVRLDRWTDDVPEGTLLQIDAGNGYQVYLAHGGEKKLLGTLEQQLPDTPVISMFIDTGSDRFAMGWINDKVEGQLRTFTLYRKVAASEPRPVDDAAKDWRIDSGSRMFFIPIFHDEVQKWERISDVYVSTKESIREMMNGGGFNPAFHKDYDPPIDIVPLLQQVTWP